MNTTHAPKKDWFDSIIEAEISIQVLYDRAETLEEVARRNDITPKEWLTRECQKYILDRLKHIKELWNAFEYAEELKRARAAGFKL